MGNYHEKDPKRSIEQNVHPIFAKIESNSESSLKKYLASLSVLERENLSKQYYIHQSTKVNPLAYCLMLGYSKMFKILLENGHRVDEIFSLLEEGKINPLSWVCTWGYCEILEMIVPFLIERTSSIFMTISAAQGPSSEKAVGKVLPFHIACRSGKINVMKKLSELCQEFTQLPEEFNIEAPDEVRGENCALIGCRTGHLDMILFLHHELKANFHALNRNKENAVLVSLHGMKNNPRPSFLEILKFLIEGLNINIQENYEEMLLIAEDPKIISYLEGRLFRLGIVATKEEIEKRNVINKNSLRTSDWSYSNKFFTPSFFNTDEKVSLRISEFDTRGFSTRSAIGSIISERSVTYNEFKSNLDKN